MPRTRNIASLSENQPSGAASATTRTRSRAAGSNTLNVRRNKENDGEKENDGRKPARSTRLHRSAAGNILGSTPTALGLRNNPASINMSGKVAAAAAPSPDPKKPKKKSTSKTTTKREKLPLQDITSQFLPAPEGANRGEGFQLVDDEDDVNTEVHPQNVIRAIEPLAVPARAASPLPPSSPPAYFLPSDAEPTHDSVAKILFESQLSSPSRLAQPPIQDPWDNESVTNTVPQAEYSDNSSNKSDPFGFVALERKLKAERHYDALADVAGALGPDDFDEDLDEIPVAGTDSPRPVPRLKRSHRQDDDEGEHDEAQTSKDAGDNAPQTAEAPQSSPILLALRPAPPTPHKDKNKRPRLSHETHNIFSPCASSIESSPSPTKASARKSIATPGAIDPLDDFNLSYEVDVMVPPTSALRPRKRLFEIEQEQEDHELGEKEEEQEEPVKLRRSTRSAVRKSVGAAETTASPLATKAGRSTAASTSKTTKRSRSRGSPLKKARQTKESKAQDDAELAEKLERERQERLDYFKRLDEYQLETEDVYII